jgi:hypothetical protein
MKTSTQTLKTLPAALLLAGFSLSTAHAALVVPAGNPLVVNDTDMNIAWTQDANLFKTMAATDPSLVSKIAAVTPVYNDSYFGPVTIDGSQFNTSSGYMSWFGGQAWVNYLNSVSYAGVTGWRLPVVTPVNGSSFDYRTSFNGSTDIGYNTTAVNATASELPHVYYNELGNPGSYDTSGNFQPSFGVTNQGPFQNLENAVYWSGTETSAPIPNGAWFFSIDYGTHNYGYDKYIQFVSWAVRPGQVAAVPIPAGVWLFGSALAGLVGFRRRRAATSDLG